MMLMWSLQRKGFTSRLIKKKGDNMAEFTLPKNSKLTKGNEYDISEGSKNSKSFSLLKKIEHQL